MIGRVLRRWRDALQLRQRRESFGVKAVHEEMLIRERRLEGHRRVPRPKPVPRKSREGRS